MKFLIFTILLNISLFASSIGTITSCLGSSEIQRDGKTIAVNIDVKIQDKDIIITRKLARMQIIFSDGTVITLGQNSNFFIQKYAFGINKESFAKFVLKKGTMRASTGEIGKLTPQNFSVNTKDMKIGVLGTNFSVSISEDGVQKAYCTYGAIKIVMDSKKFKIPAGIYLTRNVDGSKSIKEIPKQDYKNILVKVDKVKKISKKDVLHVDTKDRTNFSVQADNQTQQVTSIKGKLIVEIDGEEYEIDNGLSISLDKYGETSIDTDRVNTQTIDTINNIIDQVADISLPEPTPEPTTTSLVGFSIEANNGVLDNETTLNFTTDSSSVTTIQNSYVYMHHSGWWWKYTISDTPTNFNSAYDFETTFTSLKDGDSNTEKERVIRNTSFKTQADLDVDDHMTWGVWSTELKYNDNDNFGEMHSLWIAGEATNPSIIDNYTSTTLYTGSYRALNYWKDLNQEMTGVANMNVDFGADTATLDLLQVNGNDYSFDMTISGNTFSGVQTPEITNDNANAQGYFYGPAGDTAGGRFLIHTDTNIHNNIGGIFQVKAVSTPN